MRGSPAPASLPICKVPYPFGVGVVGPLHALPFSDGRTSVRGRTCTDWRERYRADVDRTRPDVVLVLLAGPVIGKRDLDGSWVAACEPAFGQEDPAGASDQAAFGDPPGIHPESEFRPASTQRVTESMGHRVACHQEPLGRVAG